jgi:membrane-bound ClpP family serine protease
LFVPSGGLLTVLAAISVVVSVVVAFTIGIREGVILLSVTVVLVPVVLVAAVRVWPYTPIGRLMLISRPKHPDEVLPDNAQYRGLRDLIGRTGVSTTKMLPSGVVEIDGKSYDAVGDGVAIDAGVAVHVIDVRTNRIVVRLGEGQMTGYRHQESDDNRLSRPFESLGIEDIDLDEE